MDRYMPGGLATSMKGHIAKGVPRFVVVVVVLVLAPTRPLFAHTLFPPQPFVPQIASSTASESELQTGIALTRQGRFAEAIPHLLAARGRVSDEYAATFDLALCYAGTVSFDAAIRLLTELKSRGYATPDVNDLLAQAYIGLDRPKDALQAFTQAIKQDPQDEKLYLLVADACLDHHNYDLGLQIADIGLQHLPSSARLHYQRGTFFSFQNEPDSARADYKAAAKLATQTDIYYMAEGQAALLDGNMAEAMRVSREGIRNGHENYVLLTILGSAIARSGAAPGTPEFVQGQTVLQKAIAERPNYATSRVALSEFWIAAGRLGDAVSQLEKARQLAPQDPAVYSQLAIAYRRLGRVQEEEQALALLAQLNQAQTEKYKQGSSNDKAGYGASARTNRKPSGQ